MGGAGGTGPAVGARALGSLKHGDAAHPARGPFDGTRVRSSGGCAWPRGHRRGSTTNVPLRSRGLLVSGSVLGLTDVDALTIWMTKTAASEGAWSIAAASRDVTVPAAHRGLLLGAMALRHRRVHRRPALRPHTSYVQALIGNLACALSVAGNDASGRTNSTIVELNFSGSSTNASCAECSNHTSLFDGAASASK